MATSKSNAFITSIVDTILDELRSGTRPWVKPWSGNGTGMLPLRHNGIPYQGFNVLVLWLSAQQQGYTSPYWMTFRQTQELGGRVQHGEKATTITYMNSFTKDEENDSDKKTKRIPFLKTYSVFNAQQIEGLPAHFYDEPVVLSEDERVGKAESFVRATGARIIGNGEYASYAPLRDVIHMPAFESFTSGQRYYGTLFHELIHWTGHTSRLDRGLSLDRHSTVYAFEELIAELGAVFTCAHVGIEPQVREDHAPYIASWISMLEDAPRTLLRAASAAQQALSFLQEKQPDGKAA